MIKFFKIANALIIISISVGLISCTTAPDIDTRPALMVSAEKSLEHGVSNYNENDFLKAESHFNRALFLYRNIDNPEGITASCLNIAKTKLSSGQVNEAQAYVKQAQSIIQREQLKQFDDRLTLIQSSIAIESNDIPEAKQLLDDLLNKTANNDNHSIRTAALQNRTRIAFLENNNTADWVKQYEVALSKPGQNSVLNRARLLRFTAKLKSENDSIPEKLGKALTLYREIAHNPGIAATLKEWATHDIYKLKYKEAIDKLERALFIRTNLHDKGKSKEVLALFTTCYNELGITSKLERARYWQKKLDSETFEEWDAIRLEFENYPR